MIQVLNICFMHGMFMLCCLYMEYLVYIYVLCCLLCKTEPRMIIHHLGNPRSNIYRLGVSKLSLKSKGITTRMP